MVARGDAGTVEQLLAAFDRSPQAATANAFFQQLDREEFTESPIRFAATVPVDSMRQQVWLSGTMVTAPMRRRDSMP